MGGYGLDVCACLWGACGIAVVVMVVGKIGICPFPLPLLNLGQHS